MNGDPICVRCASQEHGSPPLPVDCGCRDHPAGDWPVYRMIGGAINRQDVKGGAWTALSKVEANKLLEHFSQFSRRRFAGVG